MQGLRASEPSHNCDFELLHRWEGALTIRRKIHRQGSTCFLLQCTLGGTKDQTSAFLDSNAVTDLSRFAIEIDNLSRRGLTLGLLSPSPAIQDGLSTRNLGTLSVACRNHDQRLGDIRQ